MKTLGLSYFDEDQRGITVHSKYFSFNTLNRFVTFVDLPGHRDFSKAIAKGASQVQILDFDLLI